MKKSGIISLFNNLSRNFQVFLSLEVANHQFFEVCIPIIEVELNSVIICKVEFNRFSFFDCFEFSSIFFSTKVFDSFLCIESNAKPEASRFTVYLISNVMNSSTDK